MKQIIILFFLLFFCVAPASNSKENSIRKHMIDYPDSYIKIHDYSVYGAWGAVAILHSVVIENTSDVPYENIKVRICYSSLTHPGNIINQEEGVIPVSLPPRSKSSYLRKGMPFGGGAQSMNAVAIQVLGAEIGD